VCVDQGVFPCVNLTGSSVATPPGLASVLANVTDPWNGPALVRGTREYVPSGNIDGVYCYDASTDAACSNFPVQLSGAGYLYSVSANPYGDPNCLWVNSDSGSSQITNFDATTGGSCTSAQITYDAANVVSASAACSARSYGSLQIVAPTLPTGDSATLTVEDRSGTPVPGLAPISVSKGSFSLSTLNAAHLGFVPELALAITGPVPITRDVQVKLTWTAPSGCQAGIPYAALGDSYSSGEGLETQAPNYISPSNTDSCHRSLNAYPALAAHMLGQG
jgi:hypothetical protein